MIPKSPGVTAEARLPRDAGHCADTRQSSRRNESGSQPVGAAAADRSRSRVTIELDSTGHGIGKLLVPLIVRRQAAREMRRT
jgi:hypothetical protein